MCGVEAGEANGPPLHGFVVDGYFSPSQVGDRIVTICGTSTEGMTHTQAVNLLKNASGSIEIQVRFLSQLFRLWVAWGHMSFDVKTIKWNFLLVFYLLFPLNRNDYIESSKKVHRKYILSHFPLFPHLPWSDGTSVCGKFWKRWEYLTTWPAS